MHVCVSEPGCRWFRWYRVAGSVPCHLPNYDELFVNWTTYGKKLATYLTEIQTFSRKWIWKYRLQQFNHFVQIDKLGVNGHSELDITESLYNYNYRTNAPSWPTNEPSRIINPSIITHHLVLPSVSGIILGMGSANGKRRYYVTQRRYYVTPPVIGWAHAQNGLCICNAFSLSRGKFL